MRFRTVSGYSLLAYVNQACNVVINLVFIRSLSLHLLGEIAIAKVWMQLMDYSHLGFRFALDRYVPTWTKNKSENLLWLCLATSTVVSSGIVLIALFLTANPLLMGAFVIWGYCISITTILKNYHRALGENARMLYVYAVCPSIPVALQALTVIFFGFKEFLFVTIVAYVGAAIYLFRKKQVLHVLQNLQWRETIASVRASAVYLLLNAIVVFLSFSVDRVLLDHFAGKAVLGEYSIVLFGFSLLLIVPSTIAEFIFPSIVSRAATSGQIFFPKEIFSILLPTAAAVVVAYLAVPFFVDSLTNYGRLSGLIQLVTLGILPYAITPVLFHVMSALDMRRELLLSACVTLALYTALLAWGGMHAKDVLLFFTQARVIFGFMLVSAYLFFLVRRSAIKA